MSTAIDGTDRASSHRSVRVAENVAGVVTGRVCANMGCLVGGTMTPAAPGSPWIRGRRSGRPTRSRRSLRVSSTFQRLRVFVPFFSIAAKVTVSESPTSGPEPVQRLLQQHLAGRHGRGVLIDEDELRGDPLLGGAGVEDPLLQLGDRCPNGVADLIELLVAVALGLDRGIVPEAHPGFLLVLSGGW